VGTRGTFRYELPEVRDRICRTVCANFGFGALARHQMPQHVMQYAAVLEI